MAFRIRRKKSVRQNLRRIAGEQVDKAIAEISDSELDRHEVVHQVRKRCKKVRGLIRLVRPAFGDYGTENQFFRDAARELSYVRDAQSIIECFDALMEHFRDQIDQSAFAPVRQQLAERRQIVADDREGLEERLDDFLGRMREARHRIRRWKLNDDGYSAIKGGLMKTYGRGRTAFSKCYQEPSTENFHEWRKRVKYYWYHNRLLRDLWPPMMKAQRDAAKDLSDLLGDDHDLAVFDQTLLDASENFGSDCDLQVLRGLIDRRRAELQATARPLGARMFAETPEALAARLRKYWTAWKSTADARPKLADGMTS